MRTLLVALCACAAAAVSAPAAEAALWCVHPLNVEAGRVSVATPTVCVPGP